MANDSKQGQDQENGQRTGKNRRRTHLASTGSEAYGKLSEHTESGAQAEHKAPEAHETSEQDRPEHNSNRDRNNQSISRESTNDESQKQHSTRQEQEERIPSAERAQVSSDEHAHQDKNAQTKQEESIAAQAGSLAGAAVRNVKKNSRHNPLYLGLAVAFATASLGVAFSTFPIILSLPVAGVLLGISVWLLGHVGIINLSDDSQGGRHHKLLRLSTIGSLLTTQIVVTDIFLFTRLGSVGPHQSGIIIAWLIATAVEALAAALVIAADLHHRH
ncbi:hypothetical protein KIM372_15370 [Bombiscardovia nodaiensis]|uniref:Uncharacterized protein n=1 Tax=Bombiscardovia nodaiensis TaxID=2932181 RepID=A0ABM8B9S0_9BIFI|nr:hypothetical protein KIM372_15370 [Bombiscardovia nodaiensis]